MIKWRSHNSDIVEPLVIFVVVCGHICLVALAFAILWYLPPLALKHATDLNVNGAGRVLALLTFWAFERFAAIAVADR
jgi:predicted transporter